MILDTLLNVMFGIINLLLLPLDGLSIGTNILTTITPILQYLRFAFYIIPVPQLMPIILIFFWTMTFRIQVTLIKTLWDLLPIA